MIVSYLFHLDTTEFYQNPDVFDPERFSDENKHNIIPGTYVPFGIGPRNCVGEIYFGSNGEITENTNINQFYLQVRDLPWWKSKPFYIIFYWTSHFNQTRKPKSHWSWKKLAQCRCQRVFISIWYHVTKTEVKRHIRYAKSKLQQKCARNRVFVWKCWINCNNMLAFYACLLHPIWFERIIIVQKSNYYLNSLYRQSNYRCTKINCEISIKPIREAKWNFSFNSADVAINVLFNKYTFNDHLNVFIQFSMACSLIKRANMIITWVRFNQFILITHLGNNNIFSGIFISSAHQFISTHH